jgi:hypothetical protein
MPVGTLPIKQNHYNKAENASSKPCGGRRTRTVMADKATRLLDGQRPVPTGNVLQARPIQAQYSSLPVMGQAHESGSPFPGMELTAPPAELRSAGQPRRLSPRGYCKIPAGKITTLE